MSFKNEELVKIDYTNWRCERSERIIRPKEVIFGANKYHPERQWLLLALDIAKNEDRLFAIKDIHNWIVYENN